MRSTVAIVLLAMSVCGARAADDVVASRIAQAHQLDWSGLYVGALAGYAAAPGDGGAVGRVLAGYNWQSGRVVAGIESAIGAADLETTPDQRLGSVVDVRARLGYAFDRVLVYGTVGGVWSGIGGSHSSSGVGAGAGIDWALDENTIWGLQYIRYKFDNFRNTGNSLEVDLIEGKITYRF